MRFSIDVRNHGTLQFEADDAEHARRLVDERISASYQAISLDASRTDEELDDAFQFQEEVDDAFRLQVELGDVFQSAGIGQADPRAGKRP